MTKKVSEGRPVEPKVQALPPRRSIEKINRTIA